MHHCSYLLYMYMARYKSSSSIIIIITVNNITVIIPITAIIIIIIIIPSASTMTSLLTVILGCSNYPLLHTVPHLPFSVICCMWLLHVVQIISYYYYSHYIIPSMSTTTKSSHCYTCRLRCHRTLQLNTNEHQLSLAIPYVITQFYLPPDTSEHTPPRLTGNDARWCSASSGSPLPE